MILIKLQSYFIGVTLRHGCSPVNLLHIFKTTFPKDTSGTLLLLKCKIIFLATFDLPEQKFLIAQGVFYIKASKIIDTFVVWAR